MFTGDYIVRVQKTSAVVLVVAVACSLALQQYLVAAGLVAGAIVGIATLWSLDWIVRRTMIPGATQGKKSLMKYLLLKYPLLAAVLIPVVLTRSFTFILAFIGGMLITHLVILLKAVGGMLNQRMNS